MIKQEILILNENDIRRIIAEKYDVDDTDVCIEISNSDPQYPQLSVYAKILQSSGGKSKRENENKEKKCRLR